MLSRFLRIAEHNGRTDRLLYQYRRSVDKNRTLTVFAKVMLKRK